MNFIKALVTLLVAIGFAGCSVSTGPMPAGEQNWDFIQRAGGIDVGTPKLVSKNTYELPIRCNVTGLEEITVKPTYTSTSIMCREVKARVDGANILLTVVVAPDESSGSENLRSGCPNVILKNLMSGTYVVQYLAPGGQTTKIKELVIQ